MSIKSDRERNPDMSTTISNINYDLLIDAKIASYNGQHKELSRQTGIGTLAAEDVTDGGFPFSGDHLGTFSHRDTTPYGDPGEEVRRERIHTSDINVWALVAA